MANRYGIASQRLAPVQALICARTGLPQLVPGTLNVELTERYFVQEDTRIHAPEYDGVESLKLKRCRLCGIRAWIMRPHTHENSHGATTLEIVSDRHLRTYLDLNNGDPMEVEVDGDEAWWSAPETGHGGAAP